MKSRSPWILTRDVTKSPSAIVRCVAVIALLLPLLVSAGGEMVIGQGQEKQVVMSSVEPVPGSVSVPKSYQTQLRYARLRYEEIGPGEVRFDVTVALRRDSYGGPGAPIVEPGGTGPRYCPTCPPGSLPGVGDVIFEGTDGTRLVFGDGDVTKILVFEVRAVDLTGNLLVGIALDPDEWAKGKRVRGISHKYRVPGPFTARIDSCCKNGPGGNSRNGENMRYGIGEVNVVLSNSLDVLGKISESSASAGLEAHVVWRGFNVAKGDWDIFYRNLADGRPPIVLSTTSRANDEPWVDRLEGGGAVWSGWDPATRTRHVYYSPIPPSSPPVRISSVSFTQNKLPRISGDWVVAAGWSVALGEMHVWARNKKTLAAPIVLSTGLRANDMRIEIGGTNVIWSGLDGAGIRHVYWQDLLNPRGPIRVSDENSPYVPGRCKDIYPTLRVWVGWNRLKGTADIFFRTVPIEPRNPPIAISTSSVDNREPRIFGTKVIFQGRDPNDGNFNIYKVPDVLAFNPNRDRPLVVNRSESDENGEPSLFKDWIAWSAHYPIGECVTQILARNVETGELVVVNSSSTKNSQPWVHQAGTQAGIVWRGWDADDACFNIYYRNLGTTAEPIKVNNGSSKANEQPRLIIVQR